MLTALHELLFLGAGKPEIDYFLLNKDEDSNGVPLVWYSSSCPGRTSAVVSFLFYFIVVALNIPVWASWFGSEQNQKLHPNLKRPRR